MSDRRVGKKYRIVTKLGSGSFGEVYLSEDVETGETYAVKLEKVKTRHPQLFYESKVYKALAGGNCEGIPSLKFFGKEGQYNVMVADRLGKSLEDHFAKAKRHFEEYTTFICGYQMVQRIEQMHEKHFIHRDIKPDNFMSGYKDQERIYVIDFGLSKRYRQPRSKKHIPYKEGKSLTGTPRYASINNHLGVEQSRRDDVESIGYVLVYLAKGTLPWQGLRANTKKQKYQKIMDKKMGVKLENLCKNTHKCFAKYIEYCRSLRYEDRPNYAFLKQCFKEALKDVYGEAGNTLKPEWCPREKKGHQESLIEKLEKAEEKKKLEEDGAVKEVEGDLNSSEDNEDRRNRVEASIRVQVDEQQDQEEDFEDEINLKNKLKGKEEQLPPKPKAKMDAESDDYKKAKLAAMAEDSEEEEEI